MNATNQDKSTPNPEKRSKPTQKPPSAGTSKKKGKQSHTPRARRDSRQTFFFFLFSLSLSRENKGKTKRMQRPPTSTSERAPPIFNLASAGLKKKGMNGKRERDSTGRSARQDKRKRGTFFFLGGRSFCVCLCGVAGNRTSPQPPFHIHTRPERRRGAVEKKRKRGKH